MKRRQSATDDFLGGLSVEEQRALLAELERQALVADPLASPAAFAAAHSNGLWEPYRHLTFISDEIVAGVERDEWDLLILTTPPRHGKTELTSRWTPAWAIIKHGLRVGLASYEADFAATHGRRTKEIIGEIGEQYGVKVKSDTRSASRWELEGSNAGMWTAGVGGPVTGKGGQLLLVDDPVKNAEEAQSPVYREKVWEWWTSTFLTRREPGAKVVLIMTRWHEDDLAGRLLKAALGTMRVKLVNLPAIAEEDDALGRAPGEALCPPRYDLNALAMIRESVGSRVWASLYQQRPQRQGGSVFQRQHFHYWRKEEDLYILGDREHLVHQGDLFVFGTFDPAFTRGKRSDFTALAIWGVTPHNPSYMLLLQGYRVRVDSTEHAPMVEGAWRKWKPSWIGIEKTTASLTLLVEAQRRGVVVRPLTPDKSKGARAETAAALYEAGRIYHPRDTESDWLSTWEDELLSFPVAAHDDTVDVTSYAAIELARGTARGRKRDHSDMTDVDSHVRRFLDKRGRHRGRPMIGAM